MHWRGALGKVNWGQMLNCEKPDPISDQDQDQSRAVSVSVVSGREDNFSQAK